MRLIKHFFIAMLLSLTASLFVGAAANAASYNVTGTGGVGLRARSAPNTSSGVIRTLPEGAAIDITCQTNGETIRGSAIWDKLSDGSYISDFYTTTPVYAAYSPGIPVCGSSTTPTTPKPPSTPKPKTREEKAVAWAKTQSGATKYIGYCDRFVAEAYGKPHSGYWTAGAHLAAMAKRNEMHYRDWNPPAGAFVFFFPGPKNAWGGHVMISTGDGKAISSEHWVSGKRLGVGSVSIRTTSFGVYAGWSPANAEWTGR
jgi:uncharacterized protein YraI